MALKIVHIIANSQTVPYFKWFAQKAQQQNKFIFSFVCMFPTPPLMIEEMRNYGIDCYWIPYDMTRRKTSLVKAFFSIYKLLKSIAPDVLHTHLFDDSLVALLAGKLLRIKKRIITKNDTAFHYYYTPKWVVFDKLNNANATKIAAISMQSKKFIHDIEKAPKDKIELVHHGVSISEITNQDEEVKKSVVSKYNLQDKFVIGNVSRLIDWKGHKYIIEAASIVTKFFPNVIFLFIGKGEKKDELKSKIKSLNLEEYFIFIDNVEPKNIPSYYGVMQLYVHAASYEPFGFVIAEAILNGVPIVSTKTGAAADIIINQENGILVSEKNATELANGIMETLKNYKRALEMSNVANKQAEKIFNFDLMWSKYTKLYEE